MPHRWQTGWGCLAGFLWALAALISPVLRVGGGVFPKSRAPNPRGGGAPAQQQAGSQSLPFFFQPQEPPPPPTSVGFISRGLGLDGGEVPSLLPDRSVTSPPPSMFCSARPRSGGCCTTPSWPSPVPRGRCEVPRELGGGVGFFLSGFFLRSAPRGGKRKKMRKSSMSNLVGIAGYKKGSQKETWRL